MGIVYIGMLIETFCGRTYKFMDNVEASARVGKVVNEVRVKPPELKFTIQNYHIETHYHHRNGRTERRQVRVNTHYAELPFRFMEWYDASPDVSAMEYIKLHKLTRVVFEKHYELAPQA